jgi:hypothetical protein
MFDAYKGYASMTNRPHVFKDSDIKRIVKSARAAGLNPTTVEVDLRTALVRVLCSGTAAPDSANNPWDRVNHATDAKRSS